MTSQSKAKLTIESKLRLNDKAIEEVLNLESVCLDHDKLSGSLFIDQSLNIDHRIKSFFLLYYKGKLISMLSMFIPTIREVEITAYTHPKYRRKGLFKALLAEAMEELIRFSVPKTLLICESASITGRQVIDALNAEYEHTEYFMRLDRWHYNFVNMGSLRLLMVEEKNLEEAILANMKVFEDSYDESKSMVMSRLELSNREQYLALLDNEIIGVIAVNLEGEDVSIYGFGVLPEYRCKGYGKEILHLMIDSLLKRGRSDITIEVNSENRDAIKLYRNIGFQIEVAYDYYRLDIFNYQRNRKTT